MDFHSSLRYLASSLKSIGLHIFPKSWTKTQDGSWVHMNIEFQLCTLPHQEAQVHVINHPVRTFQRKSPSTLARDRIRQEKYMKKMANQSLESHERQISEHSVNLNVHAAEFEPKTVPVHNPKPDEYDWPFTYCETSKILHTMDHVDILKTDLIQTKSHLKSVTKVLETFKCWLQQKKFCTKFSCLNCQRNSRFGVGAPGIPGTETSQAWAGCKISWCQGTFRLSAPSGVWIPWAQECKPSEL